MAKRRKLTEGKKNIIAGLLQEYDIQTAQDIEEALKDLLGGTIQSMLEAELDNHLGYDSYERSSNTDYRNGTKPKTLRSSYGEIPIDVPQDRDGDFEPKIVPKRKKDISEIERIVTTFLNKEAVDDFSVAVTYDEIKEKGYSLSAGQYFDIKIDYVDITEEEFNQRMTGYKQTLTQQFEESHRLETEIMKQLDSLGFNNVTR